ncbi:MAG: hypothetical protein WC872_04130 [Candidatus Absconditabacterales bacterium]
MEINVYNAEKFERTKRRYLIFSVVFASVLILSILNKNLVGAILLFFLLGGYFYYSITTTQVIKMLIQENELVIGDKVYVWSSLNGYALEMDMKTESVKNIIILTNKGYNIHTIDDSMQNVKNFVSELDKYIQIVDQYDQTFLDKLVRKLKL